MTVAERSEIAEARRWVVKVGSALLTDDGRGLDAAMIATLVEQLVALRQRGCEVVLVSSGAVAAGIVRLGWSARPHLLHQLQAAAAVGQSVLVQGYENAFKQYGIATAQILLVHDDVTARDRYLNARGTLNTLLELGDEDYRLVRAEVGRRERFFQHLEALTTYLHFPNWAALMDFMMRGLEIGPYTVEKS